MHYDVAVIGAGIVGLWTTATLQKAGYNCVLLEKATIGSAQTLASQGIIHGGTKYALTGKLTGSSEAVRGMPERWRQHLAGKLSPDLSAVTINTPCQWMWDAGGVSSRVSSFFASKLMSSRVEHVDVNDLPGLLRGKNVYQLQEPILDVRSVLEILATGLRIYQAEVTGVTASSPGNNTVSLQAGGQSAQLTAKMVIYTAGEGNQELQSAHMQRRPLHMVMVKGELPALWGHVIEANANPRLTITSHKSASDQQVVWYLGGQLAETGAGMDDTSLLDLARAELGTLFPEVDWSQMSWATLLIDRAEGQQADGSRPANPVITQGGYGITAWPTKLVFAPLVADEILERVRTAGIQPSGQSGDISSAGQLVLPPAVVGEYPWDTANWL